MRTLSIDYFVSGLKGHCHGDFAVFWSKLLKHLTKNLLANMKLFLEHREENLKRFLQGRTNYISDFSKIHKKNLKKLAKHI